MTPPFDLSGRRALVTGIANAESIATGCAAAFRAAGARVAASYQTPAARPHVAEVADRLGLEWLQPLDVRRDDELEALFAEVDQRWGGLDILLHSIAFAPKADLHGRVVDCSAAGFAEAMDISCHSFIRMARLAEPRMTAGGCLLTVTYEGAGRVVPHYNMMGPVKAALESVMRCLACELGAAGIRVHALSPGPIPTRAARGLDQFEELRADAARRAPIQAPVTIDDVGAVAVLLASDAGRHMTGTLIPIDGGAHLRA